MIPIQIQPELANFNDRVRKPGIVFLNILGRKPTHKDWKEAWLWNRITKELYQAYSGICAYSASWIPSGTIDHFIPRSCSPDLAYEWGNYRLAMEKLGNRKGNKCDLIDPFYIEYGWFTLNFATFLITPNSKLPKYLADRIKKTIQVLCLNTDNNLINTRIEALKGFASDEYPLSHLEKNYPFIAYELKRQEMETRIKVIFHKRVPVV